MQTLTKLTQELRKRNQVSFFGTLVILAGLIAALWNLLGFNVAFLALIVLGIPFTLVLVYTKHRRDREIERGVSEYEEALTRAATANAVSYTAENRARVSAAPKNPTGQSQEIDEMISYIVKLTAIASCLVVAAWAPLGYFAIPALAESKNVVYWASMLINFGTAVWVTYLVSNTLSAFVHQTPVLNWLDTKASWVALFSFAGTLVSVLIQMGAGASDIWIVLKTSNATQILVMLFLYSIVDVFVLQRIADRGLVTLHLDPATDQGTVPPGPLKSHYARGLRRIGPLQETVYLDVDPDGYVEPDIPAIDELRLVVLATQQLATNGQTAASVPAPNLEPQPA
jgi:hypothetical protein